MNVRFALSCLVAASATTSIFGNSPQCESIKKIACGADDFDFLCWALKRTDLDDVLNGSGFFTVFAPTDDAFRKTFGDDVRRALRRLPGDALEDLLLYHVYDDEAIEFADLGCNERLTMANDERSRT
jgi:uncharacterized surface protein with fasciclin (FAS1) repeats